MAHVVRGTIAGAAVDFAFGQKADVPNCYGLGLLRSA